MARKVKCTNDIITVSKGDEDIGKIPALGCGGKLHPSVIPNMGSGGCDCDGSGGNGSSIYIECTLREASKIPISTTVDMPIKKRGGIGDILNDQYIIPYAGFWIFTATIPVDPGVALWATLYNYTQDCNFSLNYLSSVRHILSGGMYCNKGDIISSRAHILVSGSYSFPSTWVNSGSIVFSGVLINSREIE